MSSSWGERIRVSIFGQSHSAAIGAVAVVTTATDSNGRFSVDEWAAQNGFHLSDMGAAKAVSAAILERDVPILSDLPIAGELPPGLMRGEGRTENRQLEVSEISRRLKAIALDDADDMTNSRLKYTNKLKALELLGKHLGLFTDKVSVEVPEGGIVMIPAVKDE